MIMMMIITRYNTCDAFITLMMMMIICINLDDDLYIWNMTIAGTSATVEIA